MANIRYSFRGDVNTVIYDLPCKFLNERIVFSYKKFATN